MHSSLGEIDLSKRTTSSSRQNGKLVQMAVESSREKYTVKTKKCLLKGEISFMRVLP